MVTEQQKKSNINDYKFAAIFGSATVIFCVLIVFLVGQPLYKSMDKKFATIKEKDALFKKLDQKLSTLKSFENKEVELKEKNKKLLEAFPTDKDVPRLFVQFENIAKSNKLFINKVEEEKDITANSIATSTCEMNSGGGNIPNNGNEKLQAPGLKQIIYTYKGFSNDYISLKKTLTQLEKALRVLSIDTLSAKLNLQENYLELTFKVYTFVKEDK